ncbi:MAG: oxygen-independent coproporphyrinogen III oxidase [Marinomonas sp.]
MLWDQSLITKYNLSGPRYTSYPTAPQFDNAISKIALIDKMLLSRNTPISLYFHIPFCAHLCYYCACNKVVTKQYDKGAEYVELLEEEMRLRSLMLDCTRPVTQLHFGGGTPTFLSEEQFTHLFSAINEYFTLVQDGSQDYSIEIDPREITLSKMQLLVANGINRISIGVQDFDIDVQTAIHRVQPVEMVETLLTNARSLGIKSVNFDLIYGLPKQSLEGFKATLLKVIELDPDRISVFNYAHLPDRFRPQQKILDSDLPSPELKLSLLKLSIELLSNAGYDYIGMDHFAKPTDSLKIAQEKGELQRNFQGYTTHAETDLIAFGVSAISHLNGVYIQNHTDLSLYQNSIENGQLAIMKGYISNTDDLIRHDVIMALISQFELCTETIEKKYKIRFNNYFAEEMQQLSALENDGIVEIEHIEEHTVIRITESGRLLIRCVCMVFDKYLSSSINYSKVI